MGVERCGRCGVPIYVRLAAVWNDDGTITGRLASSTRVVQIYSSEINYILDGISERIGLDISRIVVEGERKAGVQLTGSIFGKWKGLVGAISRSWLFSRMVFGFVLRAARNAGLGRCQLAGYRRNSEMKIEVSRPFNVPILAGDILGAFEVFARRPGEVFWEMEGDWVKITVRAGGERAFSGEERLEPRLPVTIPARFELQRCSRCHTPLDISRRYRFDLEGGIATEVDTGRRVVTVIIDSLLAVFRELEEELGPEVQRMIVDLESEFIKGSTPTDIQANESTVWELLGDLRIKGMGNPTEVSVDEAGMLRVRVENPFSEELLAGRVLGIYQALWAGPARVEWTPDTDGYTGIEATGNGGEKRKE